MKLTIEQHALMSAISQTISAAPARATIPILQNFLLEAKGGIVKLTATDLDIEVSATASASVDVEGRTTVSARTLSDVVKRMPKGALVSLDLDGDILTVKAGRIRASIATIDAGEFPEMASSTFDAQVTLTSREFVDLFDKVSFASSTEETRYYLNGVYLHNADGVISSVATDGHRLANWRSQVDTEIPPVIVPSRAVAIAKAPEGEDVTMHVSQTKIKFSTAGWSMVSKTIDGTFPDYTRIIPTSHKIEAKFSGAEMKAAVDRVGAVLDKTNNAVVIDVSQDGIKVSGRSGINEIEDFVDADVSGDDLRIGFNSKYVVSAMSVLEGIAVARFSDSLSPSLIKDDADPSWQLVLMPVRC